MIRRDGIAEEATRDPTRLRLVDDAIDGRHRARRRATSIAEDEQLGGRFVTLHGRRQVNFGSCSYVGLETDLRLKDAACDAVARYGVAVRLVARLRLVPAVRASSSACSGAMFDAPLVVAQTTTLAHFAALPILVGKRRRRRLRPAGSQQRAGGAADAGGRGHDLPLRPPQPDGSPGRAGGRAGRASTAGSGTSPTASTACTATRRRWTSCASWRRVTSGCSCTSTTPTA